MRNFGMVLQKIECVSLKISDNLCHYIHVGEGFRTMWNNSVLKSIKSG